MTKNELFKYIRTERKKHTEYIINSESYSTYPFKDIDTDEVRFSVALIFELKHKTEEKRHNVILAFDGKEYFFWCGDSFIENNKKFTVKKAKELIEKANSTVVSNIEESHHMMEENYNKYNSSTGCRFWATWKSKGQVCSHVKHVFDSLTTKKFEDIETLYKHFMSSSSKSKTKKVSLLKRYSFKKHILITGPKGFGKTYGTYQFLDDEKIPAKDIFEVGGFEGLESIDLLGQNIPFVKEVKKANKSIVLKANNVFASQDGTEHIQDLVWMDGALTAAFRNASLGNKTVLLIDEMLRIPPRELSILVAALTPNNKGEFTLRTRRVTGLDENGCGIEEVIKCKKENLWVTATTNIGAEYDVEEIESALADRFLIIHKSADRNEVKEIITSNLKQRKFKVSNAAKLMQFFDKMFNYKKTGNLSKLINTRHLSEIVEFAIDEDDIPEVTRDQILKWVDRDVDGEPDTTQVKLIEKTIDTVWS